MKNSRIVYSINIQDIQNVAEQEFDRELTDEELKLVENKTGDYIDWYGAIELTINDTILNKE